MTTPSVWAYVIVFSQGVGTREEVQGFLDSMSEVTYWYSCLPMCVFFTSTLTAGQISSRVRDRFGTDKGQRHLIMEVHKDRQGWLPEKAWHMFRQPADPILGEGD